MSNVKEESSAYISYRKILGGLKVLTTRAFVYYILFCLLTAFLVDYKRIEFGFRIRVLDYLMPKSFQHLINYSAGRQSMQDDEFVRYLRFYEKVTEYFPERADAFGMLGYCYYFTGWKDKAVFSLERAIELQPDFFWFYYNLGIIEFNKMNYARTLELMEKAVKTQPQNTLDYILSSKVIYRSIYNRDQTFQAQTKQRLIKGYRHAYLMMVLSQYHLKNYKQMWEYAQFALTRKVGGEEFYNYYAGLALYHLEKYPESIKYFEKCLSIDADFSDAISYMGLVSQKLGNELEAEEYMKKAQQIKEKRQDQGRERISLQFF